MRQRIFTGVVTQLQDRHGTVDRDVSFAMSVVVGRAPLIGDKVLVKAVQDPLQYLKWTAQRVQVLNGQPFKSPPPLLHSTTPNLGPGILGNKRQPLLKSPKIPPLIPGMQPNPGIVFPGGILQIPHHQNLPWSAPWGVGSRKRHNELVAGRRGRHWEEPCSSWGADNANQKRRRWKAPSEEEASKKASQPSVSSPFFSFFPRDSPACDNLELQRRYPHLHAPPSLFHVQLSWPESFPPGQPLPLAGPCYFHVTSPQPKTEPTPDSTNSSIYSVKVLLLSMPSIEDFYTQCCNYEEDGKAHGDMVHPTALFKFLLLDKAGELQLPGGSWSKEDGCNPAKDTSGFGFIRTAVRCVMEQMALDISACTQWHKMTELRLLSEDKVETVVILMPDVWNLVPTSEDWAKTKEERGEEESPFPDVPSLVVQPPAGFTLSPVSLSSLLESRGTQTRETFEVGLVSELFSEMLQRDFGLQLYHSLCSLPQTPTATLPDSSIQPEDSSTALDDEAKKSSKGTRKKGETDDKKITKNEEDEELKMDDEQEDGEQAEDEEEAESHTEDEEALTTDVPDSQSHKDIELPRRVLLSWAFFDRHLSGSLREEDVQNILLSLGLYLTTAQAQDLVKRMSVDGKCMYRKLCSHWTDTDEVPYDLSDEGNKPLLPGIPRKEKATSRRSSSNANPDVINYKGTVLNIPNLLQHLESSKAAQREMEKQLTELQAMLEEARAKPVSDEQEHMKSMLEQVEELNKTYEKSLKENAGHMLTVIEKMQKMVDQTTNLTRTKDMKNN